MIFRTVQMRWSKTIFTWPVRITSRMRSGMPSARIKADTNTLVSTTIFNACLQRQFYGSLGVLFE